MPVKVLEWIREQDPGFKDVSDEELAPWIAEKDPAFLQDQEFKAYVEGLSKQGEQAAETEPQDDLIPLGGKIGSPIVYEQKKRPFFKRKQLKKSGSFQDIYGMEEKEVIGADGQPTTQVKTGAFMKDPKMFEGFFERDDDDPVKQERKARREEFKATSQKAKDFRLKYQADLNLLKDSQTLSPDDKNQAIAQLEADFVANMSGLGMSVVPDMDSPIGAAGRTINFLVGTPLQRGGAVTKAAVADLASILYGVEANNIEAFSLRPNEPLPIEKIINEETSGAAWASGKMSMAISDMIPFLGSMSFVSRAAKAAGASSATQGQLATHYAAGAMGFNADGTLNPVGLAAAYGIPAVDKFGRAMTAKAFVNTTTKIRATYKTTLPLLRQGKYFEKEFTRLKWFAKLNEKLGPVNVARASEFIGGQLLTNAYLAALHTPAVMSSENPGEAAAEMFINNFAMSLLAVPHMARQGSISRVEFNRRYTENPNLKHEMFKIEVVMPDGKYYSNIKELPGPPPRATTTPAGRIAPKPPAPAESGTLPPVEIYGPKPQPKDVTVPEPTPPAPEPAPEPPARQPEPAPPATEPAPVELTRFDKIQNHINEIGVSVDEQVITKAQEEISKIVEGNPQAMELILDIIDINQNISGLNDEQAAALRDEQPDEIIQRYDEELIYENNEKTKIESQLRELLGEIEPKTDAEPPSSGDTFLPVPNQNVVQGEAFMTFGSKGSEFPSRYAWVPVQEIQPSHVGDEFAPNELYKPLRNTRDYSALPSEKEKVIRTAEGWKPHLYTTHGPSAGDGPVMVSQGTDGVFRVLGGNGRFQSIQRLNQIQQTGFGDVQNQMAEKFGLPSRPSDDHLLVRLLPATDLATPEAIENANRIIDLLNPSEGLVEQTDIMAVNDAGQIAPDALADVSVAQTLADRKRWFLQQIAANGIDFNTRRSIVEDDARFSGYLQRMLVQGAYQNTALTKLAFDENVPAVFRGLVDVGVPTILKLRSKGETRLADSFAEMINGVVDLAVKFPRKSQKNLFKLYYGQGQLSESPEIKLSRGLAALLSEQIILQKNQKIKKDETLESWQSMFTDIYDHINRHDPNAMDFFEDVPVFDIVQNFVKGRLGPDYMVEDPNNPNRYVVKPNPDVVRYKKLAKKFREKGKLSQKEVEEMRELELALGQTFFTFDNKNLINESKLAKEKDAEAKARVAESQSRQLNKDQAAQGLAQQDMFSQGDGFQLFDGDYPLEVESPNDLDHYFPGFENIENNVTLSKTPTPKKNELIVRADRQLQLGGLFAGSEPDGRNRTRPARPPKEIVRARKRIWPRRRGPNHVAELIPAQAKILRPHQVEEVNRALDAMNQGKDFAIFSGTGAGKTMVEISIAAAAIEKAKRIAESQALLGEQRLEIDPALPRPTVKPVLIVTESDSIIYDAFARDSEMLGVKLHRYRGEEPTPDQEILVATYTDIAREVVKPGNWQSIIFDEAHNLRNQGESIKAHRGRVLAESANHAIFATATPLDKPHGIYYLNSLLVDRGGNKISPEVALLKVGLEKVVTTDPRTGDIVTQFNPVEDVTMEQIENNIDLLFDNMTRAGLAVKHEVPLDNIDINFKQVRLTPDQHAEVKKHMDDAQAQYELRGMPFGAIQRLVMMTGRAALESQKALQAMELTKQLVSDGRQVVLFASRVNGGQWNLDNGLAQMFADLNRDLPNQVGRLFGSAPTEAARAAKQETIDKFQEGTYKVVLATPETGGTGVSLDDLYGDAPRTLIAITPPFSALEFVQMAGRVNRLTTASRAEMYILDSGHRLDSWNSGIILAKLRALGAAVEGEIKRTNIGTVPSGSPRYKSERQVDAEAHQAALGVGANPVVPKAGPLGTAEMTPQRVFARRVRQDIASVRGLEIVGRKISNINQAADVFQLFRNPSMETFRWVLTKGGKVVHVLSLSSRMPTSASALSPGVASIESLINAFKVHGADRFWMTHNHPSGNPTPSLKDMETTKNLVAHPFLKPLFAGALITNHRKAASLDADGKWDGKYITTEGQGADPLLAPEIAAPISKSDLVQSVARVATDVMQGSNHAALLYVTTDGNVRSMAELNMNVSPDELVRSIRREARNAGAGFAVAYYTGTSPVAANVLDTLLDANVLWDVVVGGGVKATSRRQARGDQPDNSWFGVEREVGTAMVEDNPRPKIQFSAAPIIKGKVPATTETDLGGWDNINPVMLPELVSLAKELLGELPKLRKLKGGTAGLFSYKHGNTEIFLDRSIFLDPTTAAKVLAHEIGHLGDYLSDLTLARGNILGRLASLRNFTAKTFPILKGGGPGLTKADRSRIRYQAQAEAGKRPDKSKDEVGYQNWLNDVKEFYAIGIKQEIAARKLAEADVIRAELIELSEYWHPYDKANVPQSYIDYRENSKELYADALSVMLNSPGLLQEMSPVFYQMFWEYIDKKPEVKKAFFGLQQFLNNGQYHVVRERAKQMEEMFVRGEEILLRKLEEAELRRKSWKGYKLSVMQAFDDARFPAVQKVREAERNGADIPASRDPRNFFEQEGLLDNRNQSMFKEIHRKIINELDEFGITDNVFGRYLTLKRIINERYGLANPMGLEPVSAQQQLLDLRLMMGFDRMTIMERAASAFHDINLKIVEEAVQVGAYNKRTFLEKILPNKDNYATFAALDYLDTFISPGIKEQMGTLRDIANPMTATVMKLVALNHLIALQKSKRSFINLMNRHFPTEITKVPTRRNKELQVVPTKSPDPGNGFIEVLENGSPAFYEVEKHIADSFVEESVGALERSFRPLDTMFRSGFYPFWITYNIAFQAANLKRDFSRTRRNIDVGAPTLAKAYIKALWPALRRSLGKDDPLVTELMENYAISDIEMTALKTMNSGEVAGSQYYDELLRRYNLLPKKTDAKAIIRLLGKLGSPLVFTGQVMESLPKLAAGIVFKDRGVSPKEFATEIRNFVGTPNVYKKGKSIKIIRSVVPFWGVFLRGWKADFEKATNPKSRSGWWKRFAAWDGMWAAGLLGTALKELFDGVSDYDIGNYNILPIGTVADEDSPYGKKVVYIRIPKDETSRLLSGVMYIMTRGASEAYMKGEPLEAMQSGATSLDFGSEQLPGWNPVIPIMWAWKDYVTGGNPRDGFGDRTIIPTREHSAGGIRGLDDMLIWTFSQTGLQDWIRYDKEGMGGIEGAVRMMPGVHRFVKITDYGYREKQRKLRDGNRERRDEQFLLYSDRVQKLHREYYALQSIGAGMDDYVDGQGILEEGRNEAQQERYEELADFIRLFNEADQNVEDAFDAAEANDARKQIDEDAIDFEK